MELLVIFELFAMRNALHHKFRALSLLFVHPYPPNCAYERDDLVHKYTEDGKQDDSIRIFFTSRNNVFLASNELSRKFSFKIADRSPFNSKFYVSGVLCIPYLLAISFTYVTVICVEIEF